MNHLNAKQLRAYAIDELSQDASMACEAHLATCKECVERVKAFHSLREHFDQIWSTWTVATHAEEFQVERLRHALEQAQVAPDLGKRLARWALRITDGVSTALSVCLDASRGAVDIVQGGCEFLRGQTSPLFMPVPVPVSIAGEGGGPTWVAVEATEPLWTRITVDPVVRRVIVQSEHSAVPRPMVALVARDGAWAAVTPFRSIEGERFVLAEFDEIPSGDFLLLIESTPARES